MTELTLDDFGRELLAQREWLSRLAHTLVSDPASADDLVQDTWAAALRTRPRPAGGLRGWLATVLRNNAVSRRRSEARRTQREHRASRPEATESTRDVVERAALQQEVVAAVMGLDEAYREVILLRYFEDLSPRDIALRLGVPVSTVKTRLARAAERLRERLDLTWNGGRTAWMGALGVWIDAESATGAGRSLAAAAAGLLVVGGATFAALEWRGRTGDADPETEDRTIALAEPSLATKRRPLEVSAAPAEGASKAGGRGGAAASTSRRSGFTGAIAVADEWMGGVERVAWPKRERTPYKIDGAPKRAYSFGAAAPPGFALVERFEGEVGRSVDAVLDTLVAKERDGSELWLAAETPVHAVEVEAFALQQTEATVEQVQEIWHRPGPSPNTMALTVGGGAPKGEDGERAWTPLWLPTGHGADPGKDLGDRRAMNGFPLATARHFAERVGVRLPTEFEFEAAIRGRKGYEFPWGKRRELKHMAVLGSSYGDGPLEVGTRKDADTRLRLYDLLGNLWEWTESPFTAYPNWRRVPGLEYDPPFGEALRVIRGGSFLTPGDHVSATTRRGLDPGAQSEDVGFRFAASLTPGLDRARQIVRDLSPRLRPHGARFDLDRVVACDRWIATEPKARKQPKRYAVLHRYDYAIWVPLEEESRARFARQASGADDLQPLGLLATNLGALDDWGVRSASEDDLDYSTNFNREEVFLVCYSSSGSAPPRERIAGLFEEPLGVAPPWPDSRASRRPSFVLLKAGALFHARMSCLPWKGANPGSGEVGRPELLSRLGEAGASGLAFPVESGGAGGRAELRVWFSSGQLDGSWRRAED